MKTFQEGRVLRIAGYAALFDTIDAARDTIVKGAFARTLSERRQPLPLLWQHQPAQLVGTVELAQEDNRGLRIIAKIDNLRSRAAAALLDKAVNGLSFGYRARLYRWLPAGRLLEDIDLLEISLVTYPVQHEARVHLVQ
jgi:HK97 family phage prohead protease